MRGARAEESLRGDHEIDERVHVFGGAREERLVDLLVLETHRLQFASHLSVLIRRPFACSTRRWCDLEEDVEGQCLRLELTAIPSRRVSRGSTKLGRPWGSSCRARVQQFVSNDPPTRINTSTREREQAIVEGHILP